MDIIDGFLDSHYTYTYDDSRYTFAEKRIQQHVTTISREISYNHINVIYFASKQILMRALAYGFARLVSNMDEDYVLIS
tara:strand:- start:207 stop:443 length:237 start_codon:yes stop_codon:yes gene_type:complete